MTIGRALSGLGAVLGLVLWAAGAAGAACDRQWLVEERAAFQEFTVTIFRDPAFAGAASFWPACLEIRRDGRLLHAMEGSKLTLARVVTRNDNPLLFGQVLTGRGLPNLVVHEHSGGAHCCWTFHVLELGELGRAARRVGRIDAGHDYGKGFIDVDGDGTLEYVGADWTFAYWKTSFASSPAPRVVLRYRAGRFRLAPELMRGLAPPRAELERRARLVEFPPGTGLDHRTSPLWETMLQLIYTGNAGVAWDFLDLAWPQGRPGKDAFRTEFLAQLRQSPHWADLLALNHGRIAFEALLRNGTRPAAGGGQMRTGSPQRHRSSGSPGVA